MRIGEVARRSGVSVRMLRHYDSLGLVSPRERTSAGYREYAAEDLRRILHVEGLRALGLGLAEIGSALDDPEYAPQQIVGGLIRRTQERIASERELLGRLRDIEATDPADWEDVLRTVGLLRALRSEQSLDRQRAALAHGTATAHGTALARGTAPARGTATARGTAPIGGDVQVSGDVRVSRAAGGAGRLPAEQLAEALLAEDEVNVAGALRWALRQAAEDSEPTSALLRALERGVRSAERTERRRTVDGLAVLPGKGAASLLAEALADAEPAVRGSAALALADRDERAAVDVLLGMVVAGDRDVEAAEALGRLARAAETGAAHADAGHVETMRPNVADQGTAHPGTAHPGTANRYDHADAAVADPAGPQHASPNPVAQAVIAALAPSASATPGAAARWRLVQALGELPFDSVGPVLTALAGGPDPAAARIARYLLHREEGAAER